MAELRKKSPDRSEEQLMAAAGRIWYHVYNDKRRENALMAEALHET